LKRVLIIGGYGNFGRFITERLAKEESLKIIVAGRSIEKAQDFVGNVNAVNKLETVALDINHSLARSLSQIKPDIVIHTSGPFQSQGYDVANVCIECGAHYIDIADGRDFVAGIDSLDKKAKEAGVLVVSGASSVPCLTSALIDHYREEFEILESVDYGITTAQKTTRGLATTAAILSYTGKPFKTIIDSENTTIYGWQNLRARKYTKLGWRLLGSCNVPDLEIFPKHYPELKTIRFYAGLELPFIHITLWFFSWLVRLRIIKQLEKSASLLLKLSFLFDWLGTANSGFHMALSGIGKNGIKKVVNFELIAKSGDGPYIPCMPAIILCKKLAVGEISNVGAQSCIGIITKDEYLNALSNLNITWTTD
jgi:saccharopine dehydrogenase-like NADP-dependent oxidoreductase